MTRSPLGPLVLLLICGCTGGRIEISALQFDTIDPPGPRAAVLEADRALWCETDDGRVLVALRRDATIPLVNIHQQAIFSLAFERLPRGRARNETLGADSVRGLVRVGPAEVRFESLRGIAALYREGEDRLRGSFRLLVNRHTAQVLGGFGKPTRCLLQGEFDAVRDPRVKEWVAETESAGFERGE